MMKRVVAVLVSLLSTASANAAQVIDRFETGNPNAWSWSNGTSVLKTSGGNPGGWLDSGVEYFSDHPSFGSFPPAGSDLQLALASGSLHAVQFDFKRLDAGSCIPQSSNADSFALSLVDAHSSDALIHAIYLGDESPDGESDWQTHRFAIDSQAADVPDGWSMDGPDGYSWTDMMHNIDAVAIFAVDPNELSHRQCWRMGVDNIMIDYGDTVFSDGFDRF
jgi:hypothetical protein